MKNLAKETVNVVLENEEATTIEQAKRFLISVCQNKGKLRINIKNLPFDELKKDYCSQLLFDQELEGTNIYHSDRVIIADDTYSSLLKNPELQYSCVKIDQVAQLTWPIPPTNAVLMDKFIKTDKSNTTEISRCLYQT